MNDNRRIVKDTMDSFGHNYITSLNEREQEDTDKETKYFLDNFFDDKTQVEHWMKYYNAVKTETNTRADPRYNMDTIRKELKDIPGNDITDCFMEFNNSHPLQDQIKPKYVSSWVNEYLHMIKGHERK